MIKLGRHKQLVANWLRWRADEGLAPPQESHQCELKRCKIETISFKENLYGCLSSGAVHLCEPRERMCERTVVSNDCEYMCIFSGAISPIPYFDETRFNVGAADLKGRVIDFEQDMTDVTIDHAFEDYGEEAAGEDQTEWAERMLNAPDPKIEIGHKKQEGGGGGKRQLTSQISLEDEWAEFISMENIQEFFNQVHINLELINGSHGVRLGLKLSKTLEHRKIGLRLLSERVDTVITDLLLNTPERIRLNKELKDYARKQALEAVRKYYKTALQEDQRPFVQVGDDIYDQALQDNYHNPLLIAPKLIDEKHRFELKQIILKLWFVVYNIEPVARQQKRLFIKDHAVALLNSIKDGLSIVLKGTGQKLVLREPDKEVGQLFPAPALLESIQSTGKDSWVYHKNDITTGRRNLLNAFQSIAGKPDFVRELCRQLQDNRLNKFF